MSLEIELWDLNKPEEAQKRGLLKRPGPGWYFTCHDPTLEVIDQQQFVIDLLPHMRKVLQERQLLQPNDTFHAAYVAKTRPERGNVHVIKIEFEKDVLAKLSNKII